MSMLIVPLKSLLILVSLHRPSLCRSPGPPLDQEPECAVGTATRRAGGRASPPPKSYHCRSKGRSRVVSGVLIAGATGIAPRHAFAGLFVVVLTTREWTSREFSQTLLKASQPCLLGRLPDLTTALGTAAPDGASPDRRDCRRATARCELRPQRRRRSRLSGSGRRYTGARLREPVTSARCRMNPGISKNLQPPA